MQQVVIDKIQGAIYGQAIGDALGLGAEFMTKTEVERFYQHGLTSFDQIRRDDHRRRWKPGSWTDDTDQMLCILDSLLEKRSVDILDIASRFYRWLTRGGIGVGNTVYSVLSSPEFLADPHAASKRTWERSGRYSAANGGVMRTSILGVWDYQYPERVKNNAERVCRITHYDPRCVGSCVVVCLTISSLLRGESNFEVLMQQACDAGALYDSRIRKYLDRAGESLEALDLDEGLDPRTGRAGRIGYTLKAMGAGIWALKHAPSYKEGIQKITSEGGDADSNAAVAGALLGARFGFSRMPQDLAEALAGKQVLDDRIERLVNLLDESGA